MNFQNSKLLKAVDELNQLWEAEKAARDKARAEGEAGAWYIFTDDNGGLNFCGYGAAHNGEQFSPSVVKIAVDKMGAENLRRALDDFLQRS